jgi:hypothetical protein
MEKALVPGPIVGFSLVVALLATAGTAANHDSRDIRHRVADAYGVHSFDQVERLSFSFNVAAGERRVRRSWTWWPKEERVRYEGGSGTFRDEPFEYLKADLAADSSEVMVAVDQRFVNDTYWLTFPFHVEWDLSAEVTEQENVPLPVGGGTARRVTVDYPDVGGYTPGDTYELYVGPDYRVLQWVFRPGGSEDERYPSIWGQEQRFGDLTFATEFVNDERGVRIWMSDISVEFAGR